MATTAASGLVGPPDGSFKKGTSIPSFDSSASTTYCPTPLASWKSAASVDEGAGWCGNDEAPDFAVGPPGLAPPGLGPGAEPTDELRDLQADNTRLQLENELLRRQVEEAIAAATAAKAEASRQPAYTGMPGAMPYPGIPGPWSAEAGLGYPAMPAMPLTSMPGMPVMPGMHGWGQPGVGQPPWMVQAAPRKRTVATSPPPMPGGGEPTTVMLRNLPNDYTRDMALALMDGLSFRGKYDFFYLPIDFKSNAGLGYAFVNFVSAEHVKPFWDALDGFTGWSLPSQKVCNVSWSNPHQGLDSHIERFRNSFLMHEDVPDEHKPVLFRDGVRASFPTPTRKLQAPRPRQGRP